MLRRREFSALRKRLRRNGQPGDVGGDAPRLVVGDNRSRTPTRLPFEIDVGERLAVGVADDEVGVGLVGRTKGRRQSL